MTKKPEANPIEVAMQLIQRGEEQLLAARAALERALIVADRLAVAAASGDPEASKKRTQALTQVAAAREAIDQAESLVRGAKASQAQGLADRKAKQDADAREHARKLAETINAKAAVFQKRVESLKPELGDLQRLCWELHQIAATFPGDNAFATNSQLKPLAIEGSFRTYLRKLGFKWARSIFTPELELPTMTAQIADAVKFGLQKCGVSDAAKGAALDSKQKTPESTDASLFA